MEEDHRVGVAGIPVVFYTPETSAGLGGGLTLTFPRGEPEDHLRPNSLQTFGLYSLKNQYMFFLSPEVHSPDDAWRFRPIFMFSYYPDTYYGIGRDVSKDDEEDFTIETVVIRPQLLRRVYSHFNAGLFMKWKRTDVIEIEDDGQLARRDLPGVDGSRFIGMGPILEWDSRDQLFYPTRGGWYRITAEFYRDWMGSDHDYEQYSLDLRHYLSVRERHVVAGQLYAAGLSGDIAFNEFAQLDSMRGMPGSLYRDRCMAFAQIEYRFPLYKRLSGVTYISAGDVMNRWSDFDPGELKFAGGAGLRFQLNPRDNINMRLDIGVSSEGVFPYFRMLEAF